MGVLQFLKKLWPLSNGGDGKNRVLTCVECRETFHFEAGEQEFFKRKGLSEPKRCPKCRRMVRGRGRTRRQGRPARP